MLLFVELPLTLEGSMGEILHGMVVLLLFVAIMAGQDSKYSILTSGEDGSIFGA